MGPGPPAVAPNQPQRSGGMGCHGAPRGGAFRGEILFYFYFPLRCLLFHASALTSVAEVIDLGEGSVREGLGGGRGGAEELGLFREAVFSAYVS